MKSAKCKMEEGRGKNWGSSLKAEIGIPSNNRLVGGLVFGLCVWAVGMLPGMFATYTFTTIAPTVIVYWTIMALVEQPLKGLIAAAIYGE